MPLEALGISKNLFHKFLKENFKNQSLKKESIVKFQKFFGKSFGMFLIVLLAVSAVAVSAQEKKNPTLVVSQATRTSG